MFLNVTHHWLLLVVTLLILPMAAQASLQNIIEEMLNKADADFAEDHLTTPVNHNAYDRYQAVLLLDKSNQRAALGVRAIADRYLVLSRAQLAKGRFYQARKLLKQSIQVMGKTKATAQLGVDIYRAEQRARAASQQALLAKPLPKNDAQQTIFELNPGYLSQKNQAVLNELSALGQRVQNTREYVLIYARNDAEGRWIYQQMRKASVGYRLRGNILRHSKPRVVLEEPLD